MIRRVLVVRHGCFGDDGDNTGDRTELDFVASLEARAAADAIWHHEPIFLFDEPG